MLKLKFAPHLKLLLLNDKLYKYAYKRSVENYTELNAENVTVLNLKQVFVFEYTSQGSDFWFKKDEEYSSAEFKEVSCENMVREKWYCDVADLDDMSILQFIYFDKNYIYFKTFPGEQEYFTLDENRYVKFSNNLKFFSYEIKK